MIKRVLNLALDLGSDSLKIAYAYEATKGKTEYGKITVSDSLVRVAFPALACYDDERERWIYGDQVDKLGNASFVKVVKITDLLSLLLAVASLTGEGESRRTEDYELFDDNENNRIYMIESICQKYFNEKNFSISLLSIAKPPFHLLITIY